MVCKSDADYSSMAALASARKLAVAEAERSDRKERHKALLSWTNLELKSLTKILNKSELHTVRSLARAYSL